MMFSVIVPCYNSKSYVRKCIDSILAQNYHNFEIILIDDGSTDGTAQILDDYATVYSPISMHIILKILVFHIQGGEELLLQLAII